MFRFEHETPEKSLIHYAFYCVALGKRYAIVSAFGVAPSATGAVPGAAGPPAPTAAAATAGAPHAYFVPAPSAAASDVDALSAFSLPTQATAPGH